jgi:intracellular sulfur oxidation DsrE/DsrF family protein
LVVYGSGVKVFEKNGPYENVLKSLKARGVIIAQCENTIRKRHIDKATLFPFISYVPSATGEIIIRGSEGWTIVYP